MTRKPTFFESFLSLITCQIYQPHIKLDDVPSTFIKDGVIYATENLLTIKSGHWYFAPDGFSVLYRYVLYKHKTKGTFFEAWAISNLIWNLNSISTETAKQYYLDRLGETGMTFKETFGHEEEIY